MQKSYVLEETAQAEEWIRDTTGECIERPGRFPQGGGNIPPVTNATLVRTPCLGGSVGGLQKAEHDESNRENRR